MSGSLPPGVITFGPVATCTLDTCPIEWTVYGYRPSLAANITFIALFGLGGILHAILGFRRKTWWFMGCMIVCSINACIGYGGRVWLYYEPFSFDAFLMQMICITIGPVWYCAATYVILGQTITYFAPSLSRVKPIFFYFGFVTCDVISLVLQAAGGTLSSTSSGSNHVGTDLALAGLAFQVATIVTFCSFLLDFIIRYFRSPQGRKAVAIIGFRLKIFFGFMFLAMLLTVVRSVYRLVELHEGYSGELIREEGLFIGLEGVLVVVSFYCLSIGHPGLVFKENTKESLAASSEDDVELQCVLIVAIYVLYAN
ncbi:parasitic phase-specific protein PSP-1 [Daldinia loculata]|nr:parasitic phase-specific protein PSP-1 [Daldinia loculata]